VPHSPNMPLESNPLFVTRDMVEVLRPRVSHVLEVVASDMAQKEGTRGMVFSDFEACAAAELQGPEAHEEAADALATLLETMLGLAE
jgi:hypothetical protein